MRSTLLILFSISFLNIFGQPGSIDTVFNPHYNPVFGNTEGPDNIVRSAISLPNGQIIIAGGFYTYNGHPQNSLALLNPDGSLDTSFKTGTGTSTNYGYINKVILQADNKLLIKGSFYDYNGTPVRMITRLMPDGKLDTAFNNRLGEGPAGQVNTMQLQADGKILLGGSFTSFNDNAAGRLVRLNADGTPDSTFDMETGFNNTIHSIAVQTDGKILISGNFTTFNGVPSNRLIRLHPNGTLDASFNESISSLSANTVWPLLIALNSSDQLYVLWETSEYVSGSTNYIKHISLLNSNGSVNTGFAHQFPANAGSFFSMEILASGKLIVGGNFNEKLLRLNQDGTIDQSFKAIDNIGNTNTIDCSFQLSDGRILIGGNFSLYRSASRNYMALTDQNGTLDQNFNLPYGVFSNAILATTIQPDGKILVGGGFRSYNGTLTGGIARLLENGELDTSFLTGEGIGGTILGNGATQPRVHDIRLQSDGKILIAGDFTTVYGTSRNRIARLNSDGSLDLTFNPGTGANNIVWFLAVQTDGKILAGGNFTTFNGTSKQRIVRLNNDGSPDNTFSPGNGANNTITSIFQLPNGKILVGGLYNTYGGISKPGIVRLNSNGSHDNSFNTTLASNSIIYDMKMKPDGKIVLGGSLYYTLNSNTVQSRNIVQIDQNGVIDQNFNPQQGPNNSVREIAIQNDGSIVIGGDFTSINGNTHNRIARLMASGALDSSFSTGQGSNGQVMSVCIQEDGKIIAAGSFLSFNGLSKNRIVRLFADEEKDIHTGSLSQNQFCANREIEIPFITVGSFDSENVFYAQLSDKNGDFSSPVIIGSGPATASDTIHGFIPDTISGGADYKIRIVSSHPVITGNDSQQSFAINPIKHTLIDSTSCNKFISPSGRIITGTGVYIDTVSSFHGCDSVITMNLIINYSDSVTDVITACNSYTWIDGITYTSDNNTAAFTLMNKEGCDSAVTLDLTINNTNTGTDIISACDSFTWMDGITYTTSNNTATFTLTNAKGCDSIVTLDLTINHSNTGTENITACESFNWPANNTVYTASGSYSTVLINTKGCDSTVTLNLIINNPSSGTDIISACDSYTWMDQNTYTTSNNTATFTLTNAKGCDSIVTLDLTINHSSTGTENITTCNSFTWPENNTVYTASGSYSTVLANAQGCDSTVTLNLIINNPSSGTDVISACNSFTWIDGITYTASNYTATFILTNVEGCDSVVTLDLTINQSSTGTKNITACNSFTWPENNTTYTTSGSYSTVLTNAQGCDSTVTLNLIINNSSSGTDIISACDSYTWMDGITYTTSNNTATFTLTNAKGCDSVVMLDLTIHKLDASVSISGFTLNANASGVDYQWLDCNNGFQIIPNETSASFSPSIDGSYAVEISDSICTDTSSCYTISGIGIHEESWKLDWNIYPNPSHGLLIIDCNQCLNPHETFVSIYDATGKLIYSKSLSEKQHQIELENTPKGLYLVCLSSHYSTSIRKLLIE